MHPNIIHVTRDWTGERLTLAQPGGLTVDITSFKAREDPEVRQALRFAHTVAFLSPETMLRLKREESAQ